MKSRLLAGLFGVAFLGSVAFAQEVTPSIGAGSKAMLFSFEGLSFLGAGAFNGGFGAKYFLTPAMAVRGGLQFIMANSKDPAVAPFTLDGSQSASRFGINAALEYHLLTTRVSPYIGAGLGMSMGSTESKTVAVSTADQIVTKNDPDGERINGVTYINGTVLDVGGIAGIEFFITKEISLAAEYLLGYSYNKLNDAEVTTGTNPTQTTKQGGSSTIGITNGGALTLSVYF